MQLSYDNWEKLHTQVTSFSCEVVCAVRLFVCIHPPASGCRRRSDAPALITSVVSCLRHPAS